MRENADVRAQRRSWSRSASIDIGSNSVRLVVYEGAVRSPTPIFNEKVLCGLGRSVASTGRLGGESRRARAGGAGRFKAIARILERQERLRAIATAACRDASDGPEFIAPRREGVAACRSRSCPASRRRELAAQGIMMGFVDADGIAGDLGGGSLELIEISARPAANQAATLPLGGLRLLDATGDRIEQRRRLIADARCNRVPWLDRRQGGARSTRSAAPGARIARLHMEQIGLSAARHARLHDADRGGDRLLRGDPQGQEALALFRHRGDLPAAARGAALRRAGAGALAEDGCSRARSSSPSSASARGCCLQPAVRDTSAARIRSFSFCAEYARLRSRSAEHACELCAWTDGCLSRRARGDGEERRLRHAACLLSDIGWRAHPDYRGEQSLNPDRPCRPRRHRPSGPRLPGACRLLPPRRRVRRTRTSCPSRLKTCSRQKLYKRARIVGGGDPRRAHAVDRHAGDHRRDAAVL